MKPMRWLFLLVFVVLLTGVASAQLPTYDSTAMYKITLYDQTRIVGKIIAGDSLKLVGDV